MAMLARWGRSAVILDLPGAPGALWAWGLA